MCRNEANNDIFTLFLEAALFLPELIYHVLSGCT